jgi:hypothetical protein
MRKLIEGLFGEAKEYMGLRVAKFRRLWNVEEQFLLTATAQNIKKMVKLLHRGKPRAKKVAQGVIIPSYTTYWFKMVFRTIKMLFRLNFCPYYHYELL